MSEKLKSLLEEQHTFPCRYTFRVIGVNAASDGTPPAETADVHAGLVQLLGQHGIEQFEVETQASSAGKYTSFRIHAWVHTSDHVITLNGAFQGLRGVKIVM